MSDGSDVDSDDSAYLDRLLVGQGVPYDRAASIESLTSITSIENAPETSEARPAPAPKQTFQYKPPRTYDEKYELTNRVLEEPLKEGHELDQLTPVYAKICRFNETHIIPEKYLAHHEQFLCPQRNDDIRVTTSEKKN
ncbi:unnamed protein product [Caenorhabditis sp. 36 PRJEB53466]|nr:unnamed protein product [Caenorhabditis sp. 36 PRJEB53466]